MQHNVICYLFLKSKVNKYDLMEKMIALKAKKKKRGGVPQSVDHAFFVCGKNRNNQIYWPKLRQFQTKSTREKKKKLA